MAPLQTSCFTLVPLTHTPHMLQAKGTHGTEYTGLFVCKGDLKGGENPLFH